jgi:predicted small integral membrane protein
MQQVALFQFNFVFLAHVLAMMSQTDSVVVAVACHGLYLYLALIW